MVAVNFLVRMALAGAAIARAAVASPAAVNQRAYCYQDNCLRAVQQTLPFASTRSQLQGCSSYMTATVTPATSLATSYVSTGPATTVIQGNIYGPAPAAGPTTAGTPVTFVPSVVPNYASTACTANATPIAGRYSSACSCAGVTAGFTTVPSPVSTVTSTVPSSTVTVTSFEISATGASVVPPNSFLYDAGKGPHDTADVLGFGTTPSTFRLDNGVLVIISSGEESFISKRFSSTPVFFISKAFLQAHLDVYAFVDFAVDNNFGITATANGISVLQRCGNYLALSSQSGGTDDVYGGSCAPVSLTLVPLP